ncbi:MAG: esterase-like activity of phytase family protein [Pontixanthobacter sp.]
MNRPRLFALTMLAILIAPGTWVRSSPKADNDSPLVSFTPLPVDTIDTGEAVLTHAWHLRSANSLASGYSALIMRDNHSFLAGSDRGALTMFRRPEAGRHTQAAQFTIFPNRQGAQKFAADLEALTHDAETGRIWAAFERVNTIERVDATFRNHKISKPAAMKSWTRNSGPESMVRLDDGRFLVISEGAVPDRDGVFPVVLFAGDPTGNAPSTTHRFAPPSGHRPVDAAQLPDGRIAILTRELHIALPIRFSSAIVVADPSELTGGSVWRGKVIASITDPAITDNYEGLAIQRSNDGVIDLWLISDDNNSVFQRNLLLKLQWQPGG